MILEIGKQNLIHLVDPPLTIVPMIGITLYSECALVIECSKH
jgi:hypothetical protein